MSSEKNVTKKLKNLGKSYDSFYASLNDANKVSDKSYGTKKHIRHCVTFCLDFFKAQNAVIKLIMAGITFGVPIGITYLKKQNYPIVNAIPNYALIFAAILVLLMVFWWIDRKTLLKVTEPTDTLFNIGAYEKFRNKDFKRHFDYFQSELLSYDDLKKEVEDVIKEEKDDHKEDVEYYEKTLKEKDVLLTKSLKELSDLRLLFNDYSTRYYKLDKIFQEVLVKVSTLSNRPLRVDELDFHYYFTVHKVETKEYKFIFGKHPHLHQVGVNHNRKVNSHLNRAENRQSGYHYIKDTLISFVVDSASSEKWVITLYPKPKPNLGVQTSFNYDTLFIEDIISLWKGFVSLIVSTKSKPINPKGESQNVNTKEA